MTDLRAWFSAVSVWVCCMVANKWPLLDLERVARTLIQCCDERVRKWAYT